MKALPFIACWLLRATHAAAQAGKVWTDDDLKKPIPRAHRQVTERELVGLRAGAYVAPPVFAPGGYYGTNWKPSDDVPAHQFPVYDTNLFQQHYAIQPLWQPLAFYPYSYQQRTFISRRPVRPAPVRKR